MSVRCKIEDIMPNYRLSGNCCANCKHIGYIDDDECCDLAYKIQDGEYISYTYSHYICDKWELK